MFIFDGTRSLAPSARTTTDFDDTPGLPPASPHGCV